MTQINYVNAKNSVKSIANAAMSMTQTIKSLQGLEKNSIKVGEGEMTIGEFFKQIGVESISYKNIVSAWNKDLQQVVDGKTVFMFGQSLPVKAGKKSVFVWNEKEEKYEPLRRFVIAPKKANKEGRQLWHASEIVNALVQSAFMSDLQKEVEESEKALKNEEKFFVKNEVKKTDGTTVISFEEVPFEELSL